MSITKSNLLDLSEVSKNFYLEHVTILHDYSRSLLFPLLWILSASHSFGYYLRLEFARHHLA